MLASVSVLVVSEVIGHKEQLSCDEAHLCLCGLQEEIHDVLVDRVSSFAKPKLVLISVIFVEKLVYKVFEGLFK